MGIGRTLIIAGAVLIAVGVLVIIGNHLPIKFGRLPGDVHYQGRNVTFYFPVVTCLLLSVVLSLVMWFVNRR